MRPVPGCGWDLLEGKETTILLIRLQSQIEKIRGEMKPLPIRCDDQGVGAVVLVINAAREPAVPL